MDEARKIRIMSIASFAMSVAALAISAFVLFYAG